MQGRLSAAKGVVGCVSHRCPDTLDTQSWQHVESNNGPLSHAEGFPGTIQGVHRQTCGLRPVLPCDTGVPVAACVGVGVPARMCKVVKCLTRQPAAGMPFRRRGRQSSGAAHLWAASGCRRPTSRRCRARTCGGAPVIQVCSSTSARHPLPLCWCGRCTPCTRPACHGNSMLGLHLGSAVKQAPSQRCCKAVCCRAVQRRRPARHSWR